MSPNISLKRFSNSSSRFLGFGSSNVSKLIGIHCTPYIQVAIFKEHMLCCMALIKEAMILIDSMEKPSIEIGFDITTTHLTNWFFKLVIMSRAQVANPSSLSK